MEGKKKRKEKVDIEKTEKECEKFNRMCQI